MQQSQMILTMFMLTTGFQIDSWRDPRSRIDDVGGLPLIADMARAAEAAKMHAVFFGDSVDVVTIRDNNIRNTGLYEPMTSVAALAGLTHRIGLVASLSTSFTEPYNAARQFASLDHLSGGRVGWNIVTSLFGGAQNYGVAAMPDSEARYRKATEFVDVVRKLWDSWADDTVIADRESGQWAITESIHDIDHVGEHFDVRGALTMMRPVQGHPVLFQAGQSPAGMTLGASVADAIYTAQTVKSDAKAFADRMRTMATAQGRDPHSVKILPGVVPIVAETEREARELADELASYVDLVAGRRRLTNALGFSIDHLDLEDRIPEALFDAHESANSRRAIWRHLAVDARLTVRELIVEFARAGGHRVLIGSPGTVADQLLDWFDDGVCDGFNFDPPSVPVGMQNMLDLLVPELQERGRFRTEYRGDTLREQFGVARPSGRRARVLA